MSNTLRSLAGAFAALFAALLIACASEPADTGNQSEPPASRSTQAAQSQASNEGSRQTAESQTSADEVLYEASGFEPGWILEIYRDRAHFTYDYGEGEVTLPLTQQSLEPGQGTATYLARTPQHTLRVHVTTKQCTAPSGMPMPTTAEVQLDGKTYSGCGGALPSD